MKRGEPYIAKDNFPSCHENRLLTSGAGKSSLATLNSLLYMQGMLHHTVLLLDQTTYLTYLAIARPLYLYKIGSANKTSQPEFECNILMTSCSFNLQAEFYKMDWCTKQKLINIFAIILVYISRVRDEGTAKVASWV